MSLRFGDFTSNFLSRAVDEDDYYGEDEKTTDLIGVPVVRWSSKARNEISSSGRTDCSSVLVAVGKAAAGFVHLHVLSSQPSEIIGAACLGIEDNHVNTLSQEAYNDRSCFIYRLINHPSVVVVQCKEEVATDQLFSWTEQIFSKLCSPTTDVSVISTAAITEYKSSISTNDLPANFFRSLKTTECKRQPVHPALEQPNIITGLPAQILTYSVVHHFSCVLYVCFVDSALPSEIVRALRGLLSCPVVKDIAVSPTNAAQELAKLHEADAKCDGLYI